MALSRSRKRWAMGGTVLVALLTVLVAARLYLNIWALDYVNRVLANIEGYEGSVQDIDIELYRGAYRIHELKVVKKKGNIPVPFIDIKTVDLSIQWRALLHGRIVSDAELLEPVLNFAVNASDTAVQTGAGVDWSKPIKDLMPIDINLVTFSKGKLTYRDFSTTPKVNIYIDDMSGEARNLRNVVDETQALPSHLSVKGTSIGKGRLTIEGKMNILKPTPDMDMNVKLEKVHLPALNSYSDAYAAIDIKNGTLDFYSEFKVKDGRVSGYIKPIATNIELIDLAKTENPIKLIWESVVAIVVEVFTNQRRDQFATKIELEGRLDNVDTDTWSAIAGIVRNAFVQALQRGFDEDAVPESK